MKWTELPIVGFDVETTGFDALTGRVIQFGFCLYDPIERKFTRELIGECDTDGVAIDPGAQKAHGISAERVAGKPSFDARLPEIIAFLKSLPPMHVALAFNAPFDLGFLVAACARRGLAMPIDVAQVLDPLPIARTLWRYGNKLTEVCPRVGVKLDFAHDAGFDAKAAVLCELAFAAHGQIGTDLVDVLRQQASACAGWERRTKHSYWGEYERVCAGLAEKT